MPILEPALADKLNYAGSQIVHSACNLNAALLLQFLQNRAAPPNVGKNQRHVRGRYRIHILGILARLLPIELRGPGLPV